MEGNLPSGAWDVAFGPSTQGLVDERGSGNVPLNQLTTGTDTLSPLTNIPTQYRVVVDGVPHGFAQ